MTHSQFDMWCKSLLLVSPSLFSFEKSISLFPIFQIFFLIFNVKRFYENLSMLITKLFSYFNIIWLSNAYSLKVHLFLFLFLFSFSLTAIFNWCKRVRLNLFGHMQISYSLWILEKISISCQLKKKISYIFLLRRKKYLT